MAQDTRKLKDNNNWILTILEKPHEMFCSGGGD